MTATENGMLAGAFDGTTPIVLAEDGDDVQPPTLPRRTLEHYG
jgi:hypothetical protein